MAVLVAQVSAFADEHAKPNVILIMADDLGYSDVGCYGSEIDTPNIDRLAEEGIRFRQFYNNAKCTTTRASLLSGCYPERGTQGNQLWDDQILCIGQAMKLGGYRTILTGKWHLGMGGPNAWGFDESYGLLGGCSDSFEPTIRGLKFGHNAQLIKEFPEDFYLTEAYADHAIAQIKKAVDAGQPYFLHLAFQAPHWPVQARPEDHEQYKGKYAEGWDALRKSRYQRMIELGVIDPEVKLSPLDPGTKQWTGAKKDQVTMELHAAMVDCMDQNIGRILALLDETGTADDTLVIFLSENGASAESPKTKSVGDPVPGKKGSYLSCGASWANAQCTPFRKYKKYGHEGGQCTPCIMRWPKQVKPGTWTDNVAHIIDLQPTLMGMAGLDPQADLPEGKRAFDGESILSLLNGQSFVREQPLFFEWVGNRAIRDGDWKAAYMKSSGKWELFNIAEDRTELNDVSAMHPERLDQMTREWSNWATEHGVPQGKSRVSKKSSKPKQ